MSAQQAEAFIARVQEDPDFADRLSALKADPAAVHALVVAEGFDATPEEIRDVFLEAFGSELTEEQIAAIVGGTDVDPLLIALGAPAGAIVLGAAIGAAI